MDWLTIASIIIVLACGVAAGLFAYAIRKWSNPWVRPAAIFGMFICGAVAFVYALNVLGIIPGSIPAFIGRPLIIGLGFMGVMFALLLIYFYRWFKRRGQ